MKPVAARIGRASYKICLPFVCVLCQGWLAAFDAFAGHNGRLACLPLRVLVPLLHPDLLEFRVLLHVLLEQVQPSLPHRLQLLIDWEHLLQSLPGCGIFGNCPLCYFVHLLLDPPPDVAFGQGYIELVVGLHERCPQVGGFEGVVVLDSVLSFLDGLDVLVDGAVGADLVLLHHVDQVRLG